jgi:hypothetical protein
VEGYNIISLVCWRGQAGLVNGTRKEGGNEWMFGCGAKPSHLYTFWLLRQPHFLETFTAFLKYKISLFENFNVGNEKKPNAIPYKRSVCLDSKESVFQWPRVMHKLKG